MKNIIKKKTTWAVSFAVACVVAVVALVVIPIMANAAATFNSFTADEVSTWSTTGVYPSGGVHSISYAGRDDVMQVSVDKDKLTAGNPVESITKDFSNTNYSIDLYLDPAWQSIPTQVGFEATAVDNTGAVTAQPAIQFVNTPGGKPAWQVWQNGSWSKANAPIQFGSWVTLHIVINNNTIDLYIGNHIVGHVSLGNTKDFKSVTLSTNNFGSAGSNYSASWHAGYHSPTDRSECNLWFLYYFNSFGACAEYVQSGHDSR